MKLDCGHEPSPHGPHDTGFGRGADERTRCYACCAELDRAAARRGEPLGAYLTNPPVSDSDQRPLVTTWPGVVLGRVESFTKARVGFGARVMWYVRARIEGRVYHGRGQGPGMYINLKPTKQPPRCAGCGRDPLTCWRMPCLVLEVALSKGVPAINTWCRKSRAPFYVEAKP